MPVSWSHLEKSKAWSVIKRKEILLSFQLIVSIILNKKASINACLLITSRYQETWLAHSLQGWFAVWTILAIWLSQTLFLFFLYLSTLLALQAPYRPISVRGLSQVVSYSLVLTIITSMLWVIGLLHSYYRPVGLLRIWVEGSLRQ